ncbi:MAG: glycosyltransferase family 39 protein [Flavobacteriales bacterium]|nr:glycosyltransferase family 39 protein [Flavobacteriales bacterium]MCB9448727.1 glycosyltransferase family 39 protein [Flavobacteriales bacterium]
MMNILYIVTRIDGMKSIWNKYFRFVFLALLIYMPLFGHLDTLPIRVWDESRLAVNAVEMYYDGDWIVTHFDGKPDMWNTKPPLMIWAQVICMKLLGPGELAVRLPSALAGFLTCVLLLVFSLRYLRSYWFGFICIMVLITTHGYLNVHSTRTGDYDALLAFFTTCGCIVFFFYCEEPSKQRLYAFFGMLVLGVLTKGIAGMLLLPGVVVYGLLQKKLSYIWKSKHFYLGALGVLAIISGYYLLREAYNPGFLNAVVENELGGRYLEINEGHSAGFWYYFNNLLDFQMPEWSWMIPIGWATGLASNDDRMRKVSQFSMSMALTYFLVISASQTKLEWYDVPIYPFLSMAVAQAMYFVYEWLRGSQWINAALQVNVIPLIAVFYTFNQPFQRVWEQSYKPAVYAWEKDLYEIGFYLQHAAKGSVDMHDCYILFPGYSAQNLFYAHILTHQGKNVSIRDPALLVKDDVVVVGEDEMKNYLSEHFEYEEISRRGVVIMYRIHGRK